MSVTLVADTQVVVWYLREPGRLSTRAASALEDAIANGGTIGVSAFSIVELVYAVEKATNPLRTEDLDVIVNALRDPDGPFEVVDIDSGIAAGVASVARRQNADPGDRLIVATAEALGAPLVSSDAKIPAMTSVEVIW